MFKKRLWTINDTAQFLSLEPDTVRKMARDGIKVIEEYDFESIAPFLTGTTLPLSAEVEYTILQPPYP